MAFAALFLEHWFTRPTDALAAALSVLLLLAPARKELTTTGVWYDVLFAYCVVIVVLSMAALMLLQDDASEVTWRNRASAFLKKLVGVIGRGKWLYFLLFFMTLFFYVDDQSPLFIALLLFSGAILAMDPKRLIWLPRKKAGSKNDIGEIFGVQSKSTFLAKLYSERQRVRRYDFVEFRDSSEETGKVRKGIIVDNYVLNAEQWIKIITGPDISASVGEATTSRLRANVVYRITPKDSENVLGRLVGSIVDDSYIMRIRFEYAGKVRISEGTLLEVMVDDQQVLYQVVQGLTEVEQLESKNVAGFIIGQAAQIGTWNAQTLTFDRFGWVPEMNTPVYLARDIDPVEAPVGEIEIGHIPDTKFPVLLSQVDAITHHMAILGVTGSGKSVFARDLIRKFAASGTKIIAVDFTEEYLGRFAEQGATPVLSVDQAKAIFESIDVLAGEAAKWPKDRNIIKIAENEKKIRDNFRKALTDFLCSERAIAVFELPDVENTTGILEFTRWFFRVLFELAKTEKCFEKQVCVVLEEAHTVIPEWNFIGEGDKGAQALVNAIGQIALQGRKYGVGFMVIAQRTANVSKTVLTQCNTIIAFQQFDRTSADFLSNYMGKEMVDALPMLRPRHAIAVGKAFRSGLPVIFRVPDIEEPQAPPAENGPVADPDAQAADGPAA